MRAGPKSQEDAERIEAVFGSLAGEPLDLDALQRKIGRQYGLDRFESVDYRLVRDKYFEYWEKAERIVGVTRCV